MYVRSVHLFLFFFFIDTAPTEIYTFPYTTLFRSLLFLTGELLKAAGRARILAAASAAASEASAAAPEVERSEEHTSELQSQSNLVCRLLLEKKKKANASLLQNDPERTNLTDRHTN